MAKSDTEKKVLASLKAKGAFNPSTVAGEPSEDVAPGSFKDDPDAAIQMLLSKANGPRLQPGATEGSYSARVPVDQPLLRLFGMKKTVPITGANFLDTVQKAGIADFLPSGLPRTPDGKPFVNDKVYQSALQAAQSFGNKTRADFFSYIGNDSDSQMPVTFNSADQKFYLGGKPVDPANLGRVLNKVRPQLEGSQQTEIVNLLNAKSQLNEVKSLFNADATGPVQARLYNASKFMGINLPDLKGMASITDDKAKMRTILASGINDYIKAITGAQMSEIEARRIMAAMPSADAADEAFMPMLEQVLKIADMKLENRLNVLETQGTVGVKELRGLAMKERDAQTTSVKETKELDLNTPDGIKAAYQSGKLSRDQAKALLRGSRKGGK